jgi:hypothetical protein
MPFPSLSATVENHLPSVKMAQFFGHRISVCSRLGSKSQKNTYQKPTNDVTVTAVSPGKSKKASAKTSLWAGMAPSGHSQKVSELSFRSRGGQGRLGSIIKRLVTE